MLKHVCVVAGLLVASAGAAWAQADCAGPWLTQPQYDALPTAEKTLEFQRLVVCSRKSVAEAQELLGVLDAIKLDQYANAIDAERQRLNDLVASRTAALNKANDEITELVHQRDGLAQQLAKTTDDLKRSEANKKDAWVKIADLNTQIASLTGERDKLAAGLKAETATRKAADDKAAGLDKQLADAQAANAALTDENRSLKQTVAADTAKIDALSAEIKRLGDQVDAETKALQIANDKNDYLTKDRDRLQGELDKANKTIADLNGSVTGLNKENADLKGQVSKLTTERDSLAKQVASLTTERDGLRAQVADITKQLGDANAKIGTLEKQVADLTPRVVDLTAQVADLQAKLDAANAKIADLEDKLGKWRSLFFGKLRDLLGNQTGIEIVGDRFVLQSEVLFATGSAALSAKGHDDIVKMASVIVELEKQIPADISWVLQVNGHTDIQKFRGGGRYRDNWDLSLARAMTVVRLLIDQGVDAHHLAAAGFGEYQPRDTGTTPEALAKNRRIELKLTDDGPLPPN